MNKNEIFVKNQAKLNSSLVFPSELECDIFHSVLLQNYINHWGRPYLKKSISKDNRIPISAYCFSKSTNEEVVYFATIGLSFQKNINKTFQKQEFFIVLPKNEVQDACAILNHLLDICVHIVINCGYQTPPSLIKSLITPKTGKPIGC